MRRVMSLALSALGVVLGANAADLPAGYTAVEYIESTPSGKQYVNTGYVPKATTKVDCVVNVADGTHASHPVVFGAHPGTQNKNMSFFAWFGWNRITAYNRGDEEKTGGAFGYNSKNHLVCEGLTASWSSVDGQGTSGSITNGGAILDGDPAYPLYIFALDEPNSSKPGQPADHTYLAMKLYAFKIYEGEVLKRDFVPCVNQATGRAGLYDRVDGKFYGNDGSGEFRRPLPRGYTAVEYIESTAGGGQYINTEYIHRANTKIVCEVNAAETQQSATGWAAVFGTCDTSWEKNAFSFFIRDGNNVACYNRSGCEWHGDGDGVVFPRNVITAITCEGMTATWSASGRTDTITLPSGSADGGACPLLIFEKNKYDNVTPFVSEDGSKAVMKLYWFRIYEGEALKRNFVPCVEAATDRVGLYDTVGKKFYENKGDGAFGYPGTLYYDPVSGETKVAEAIEVTESTSTFEDGKWYVVRGNVERDTITVNGSANLILADGAKLTVDEDRYRYVGIAVANGNALTIWGQSNGTGELVANAGVGGAGIGSSYGACGAVTINGGVITATGYSGAGIGGGDECDGGTVTINGGTVTARGDNGGAGIGGGYEGAGGTVTINGGTVTATGDDGGADIGGGKYGGDGTVTIDGGSVKAEIRGQPKNGKGDDVHCVTVEGEDGKLALEVLFEDYGMNDVVPIENKAYLWFADGTHFYNLNGVVYRAVVSGDEVTVTETPLRTASFILGKGVSNVSFTTDPAVTNGTATTDFALAGLPHGSRVFLDVGCADGYEYLGAKEFAVVAENMQVTLDAGIRLSDGYTAVAYIESTKGGGQYVDTGYKPKPERRFEIDSDPAITSIPDYSKFLQGEVAAVRGLKIYEGEKLVRDFVPCVETATGKAGLYDRVEGKYHGNAGSGELLTPLPWGYKRVNYIESTGGQYIDTGYVKTEQTRAVIVSDPAIGAVSDYSKFLQGASVRLYSFAIYEGEKLVRNFVPCVETATGEVGLCDVVRGVFHPNKGDGSFGYAEPCITAANFEQNRILRNGNTYRFAESIDYTAPDGESAMTVEDGATVTLFIPAGVTVTLTGGAADGQIGAGAGIAVPSGATLTICGAGTLNATGGKAANGASGKKGSDAGYLRGGTEGGLKGQGSLT